MEVGGVDQLLQGGDPAPARFILFADDDGRLLFPIGVAEAGILLPLGGDIG